MEQATRMTIWVGAEAKPKPTMFVQFHWDTVSGLREADGGTDTRPESA